MSENSAVGRPAGPGDARPPVTSVASDHLHGRRHVSDERRRATSRPITLSILMPVYNEESTLRQAIESVLRQEYRAEIELHIINDGSTDDSMGILEEIEDPRVTVHQHQKNLGKGAALLTAARHATGTHVIPFDADLEYSAADVAQMLEPVLAGRSDVVFGARNFGVNTRYQSYSQAIANRGLTFATNLLFNCYLSDVHTCLKLMPLSLFVGLDLRERRFGLDAELVARVLQLGIRPFEVPVSYYARSVADGKKITWRDGLHCLRVLTHVRRVGPQRMATESVDPHRVVSISPPPSSVPTEPAEAHRQTTPNLLRAP